MVNVDEALTRQVANLARLELSAAEITTFTAQLGDILKYIDQLQTVDVKGIDPLLHPVALATPLRADTVVPSPIDENGQPKILRSAPEVLQDGFKVPQIL